MLEKDGRNILYHPMTNYAAGYMSPVYEMLQHPNTLIGLGDGGAHVGIMCDATDMAHTLSHWTRDRTRGPKHDIGGWRLFPAKDGRKAMCSGAARRG